MNIVHISTMYCNIQLHILLQTQLIWILISNSRYLMVLSITSATVQWAIQSHYREVPIRDTSPRDFSIMTLGLFNVYFQCLCLDRSGILLSKLIWLIVRKNCSSDLKKKIFEFSAFSLKFKKCFLITRTKFNQWKVRTIF